MTRPCNISPVTAIILCGGRSIRMGRDKASMLFAGETMLSRVTRVAEEVASNVIIVGRRDQPSTTLHDEVEDQGPLAGIAAGLAASTTDVNLVLACDMPLIKTAVLQRLVDALGDHDACVAIVGGYPSALCGVYRSRMATEARALLDSGERRVTALLDRVQTNRVDAAAFRDIDPELDSFTSVDTIEKYEWAIRRSRAPHRSPGA